MPTRTIIQNRWCTQISSFSSCLKHVCTHTHNHIFVTHVGCAWCIYTCTVHIYEENTYTLLMGFWLISLTTTPMCMHACMHTGTGTQNMRSEIVFCILYSVSCNKVGWTRFSTLQHEHLTSRWKRKILWSPYDSKGVIHHFLHNVTVGFLT